MQVFPDTNYIQLEVFDILAMPPYLFAGSGLGVYRADMTGQNWQKTDIDVFAGQDIGALATYKTNLIAGLNYHNQYWLFSSNDMAASWEIRAHEFSWLFDLYVRDDRLWAARSDGLWYLNVDFWTAIESPSEPNPPEFQLHPNYPNPFNPATEISFTLHKGGYTELKVYDLNGREITSLLGDYKNPGQYKINFTASGLASGVYIYVLRSGEFFQSRKMLLLR